MKKQKFAVTSPSELAAALVFAIVMLWVSAAGAKPDFMPVGKVKPGMTGYGKTVFTGLEPQNFPIKVRGVLPKAGMSGEDLILIEMTGPEIEKYGGISMGMSGSPIYIHGKLIGALSLTFPNTDHNLGGVTPVEAMMRAKEYDAPKTGMVPLNEPFEFKGKTYRWIDYGDGGGAGADALAARPAVAPVAVRGVSARTYPIVRKFFEKSGVDVLPIQGLSPGGAASGPTIGSGSPIKPGSSVAVLLIMGDADFSAVGTVTFVDGKDVYLFGHPLFRKGAVKYLLADAYVHAIVDGEEMPFKATSVGALRGEVTQDRGSALMGHLGRFPEMIPVSVKVRDRDIGRTVTYKYKIVQDKEILANLIVMAVLQSLDNTIDRLGNGAATLSFTLKCSGCKEPITRENMFYDRFDISMSSMVELVSALRMLQENRFRDTSITGLEVNVEMDSTHSYASIEKAEIMDGDKAEKEAGKGGKPKASQSEQPEPDKAEIGEIETGSPEAEPTDTVDSETDEAAGTVEQSNPEEAADTFEKLEGGEGRLVVEEAESISKKEKKTMPIVRAGEKLPIRVVLQPYRSEPVEEIIYLKVPADIALGEAEINVYSGTRELPPAFPGDLIIDVEVEGQPVRDGEGGGAPEEEEKETTFDDLIRDFVEADLNNELVVDISPLDFDSDMNGDSNDTDAGKKKKKHDEQKSKKRTNWVLEGSATIKVKVVGGSFKKKEISKSKINSLHGGIKGK